MRWPKKPSQKAIRGRKSKVFEKPEEVFTTQISQLVSHNLVVRSGTDQITSSKRFKLSVIEDRQDFNHINGVRKGPINWTTPRSSRSLPNKTVRDSIAEMRHSTADILQQSCMMPPPAKVSDKTCNSQQKLQKIMQPTTDWDRGKDSLD